MRVELSNVATADGYSDAATLRLVGARRIVEQIFNAAVYYQLDESADGLGTWTNERFRAPLSGSFDRVCSGVRYRSAVAGSPARVSVELLDERELAGGSDAVSAQTHTVSAAGEVETIVSVPTGTLIVYAGGSEPSADWLLCDGRVVSRADYARLFAVIGVVFGAGDGATTFNLPDLRGRVPVGLGTHADVDTLGDSDGSALASRRPKHSHTVTDPGHAHNYWEPDAPVADYAAGGSTLVKTRTVKGTNTNVTGITVGPGGAAPVDGPAFIALNYLIRT